MSNESSDAVKDAFAVSIASESGLDAETVAITKVAEAVEGFLDFDFGDAAAALARAYEDPALRADIARTLAAAVASGLQVRSEVNNSL